MATPVRKRPSPPSSGEESVNDPHGGTETSSSAKKVKTPDSDNSTLQSQATSTAQDPPMQKPGDGIVQIATAQGASPKLPKLIGGMTQRQAWLSQGLKT